MSFRTQFDAHERVHSNPGSMIKDVMAPVLDRYGNRVIEKENEIDLYAQIQSWRDECDINILMAKFTNGDKTALMQRVGTYLDLSVLPDNFNDMLNLTTKAQAVFDSLPVDVKQVFGNNVNNFLSNSKTKEFEEILSKSPEQLRLEKVLRSKEFTETNQEAAKPTYFNPGTGLVVDTDPVPTTPIEDEVRTILKGRSLNESK